MDEALEFYVNKLGFTLRSRAVNEDEKEEFAFLVLGDLRLELIQDLMPAGYVKPDVKPPYCPHVAIETEDVKQMVKQLRDKEVLIVRGPLEIPGEVQWLYVADPDHNILEYVQWDKRK